MAHVTIELHPPDWINVAMLPCESQLTLKM